MSIDENCTLEDFVDYNLAYFREKSVEWWGEELAISKEFIMNQLSRMGVSTDNGVWPNISANREKGLSFYWPCGDLHAEVRYTPDSKGSIYRRIRVFRFRDDREFRELCYYNGNPIPRTDGDMIRNMGFKVLKEALKEIEDSAHADWKIWMTRGIEE